MQTLSSPENRVSCGETGHATAIDDGLDGPWTVRVRHGIVRHAWSQAEEARAMQVRLMPGERDIAVGPHAAVPPPAGYRVDPRSLGWTERGVAI